MLSKLIKKLFKLPEAPEPKGILKVVRNIPSKRLDVQYRLDNGEIHSVTVDGRSSLFNGNPLDLGYKRKIQIKFLGLLDQYGLSTKEYNKRYLYVPLDKYYKEPEPVDYTDFYHKRFSTQVRFSVQVNVSPGTTLGINPDKIRSVQVVENFSGSVEVFEHKVKEE
jgi:hypothetical protein